MTFLFVVLAAFFTAFANLFTRKSIDVSEIKDGDPFLFQRLLASGAVVVSVSLLNKGTFVFDMTMAILGIIGGVFLGALMWLSANTLKKGPAALTFAIINAACIAPPLLMAVIFGKSFGHTYSLTNGLGALLVVAGLFWMSRQGESGEKGGVKSAWLFWAVCAFTVHALYLTFFQWRALLFRPDVPDSLLVPFKVDIACGDCFTLFMFIIAAAMQWLLPKKGEKNIPVKSMFTWGVVGGLINGAGAICMLKATEIATSSNEKALMFPLYCVCLICICNVWGMLLYKEKVNWAANGLCFSGIVIGLL